MREHGVEPGFLTGTWMEKFGTVEGDQAREAMQRRVDEEKARHEAGFDDQSPMADQAATMAAPAPHERPKRKVWLGIW